MKFKVGDKVRIREDLVRNEEYGAEAFVFLMEDFKGKIATIKKVYRGFYKLEEFDYNWTDEMLETVDGSEGVTFEDIMILKQPKQTWVGDNYVIHIGKDGDILIKNKYNGGLGLEIFIGVKSKFRLQKEKCSFEEAFASYEEGKVIISSYGRLYRKDGDKDLVHKNGYWTNNEKGFCIEEVRGYWDIR